MSQWLERAMAHADLVPKVPKLPKLVSGEAIMPSPAPRETASVIYIDLQDRAALAEHDGGVPARFALAFAIFQSEHLDCSEALNGAGKFLDRWGRLAASLGWAPEDLFGADPPGLCRLLSGRAVVALDQRGATLSDGARFPRPG